MAVSEQDAMAVIIGQVASDLLAKVGPQVQAQILTKAVIDGLKDYKFQSKVKEHIADISMAKAAELVANPAISTRVDEAIREGVEDFLKCIKPAVTQTLLAAFTGVKKKDTYGTEKLPEFHNHMHAEKLALDKSRQENE